MKRYDLAACTAALAITLAAGSARADQVIPDDLIVQGSVCVGFDCVNNENFGFSTIRMKENNTRIEFDDTSVGTFPANDWQIVANDSASGGANFLGILDSTAGRQIARFTAGAPANSVFVDSTGRVGFRTATPVLDLHVATSNTPAMRLEQSSAGGFTAQTWDIAGNEANFFIRDVTTGSKLPFRIRPNAPTSSIDIAATGNVGLGTGSPADVLHIRRTTGPVAIRLDSGSQPNPIRLNFNTNTNEFRITYDGLGINQLRLTSAGNLIIPGSITTSGSCSVGCDRVFEPDFEIPSIEEQKEFMFSRKYLPAVGSTPEGEPMDLTRKVEGILHELEKAHIYISQLKSTQDQLTAEIDRLRKPQ